MAGGVRDGGACVAGGMRTGETVTEAAVRIQLPTGMHSCLPQVFFRRTVGKNLPSSPLCTGSCVATAHPETGRMSFTCPQCRLNRCVQAGMTKQGKQTVIQ